MLGFVGLATLRAGTDLHRMAGRVMLLTRDNFREAVFARDKHVCVLCKQPAQDAHHIVERRLWPDGGYYLDNGASLCGPCHVRAEQTIVTCDEIRRAADITKLALPPHLYPDTIWDKWGNPYVSNDTGKRYMGELYHDPQVKKILTTAGVYDNSNFFTRLVKYPRTFHLPWSPGGTDDDRRMDDATAAALTTSDVVVTAKMDGENCTMYRDAIHARSVDSRHSPDRDWVKNFWAGVAHDIPDGWRFCGENLYAKHSIFYHRLPSFFLLFSVWNERHECLSWDATVEWAQLLGMVTVPVLHQGTWPGHDSIAAKLREHAKNSELREHEGYVVRLSTSFHLRDFRKCVGKFVRKDHVVPHGRHWRSRRPGEIETNWMATAPAVLHDADAGVEPEE